MTEDQGREFWGDAPNPLDDPLGWVWAQCRRAAHLTEVVEFALFLLFGVIAMWRFLTRRLVTEDLYLFGLVILLGSVIAIQAVIKRARARG